MTGSLYFLATGHFTLKPTPGMVMGDLAIQNDSVRDSDPPRPSGYVNSPSLLGSVWAIYAPEGLKDRRWWGIHAIGSELIKAFQYMVGLPVVLGLWWFRQRMRQIPGAWVLAILCLLHCLVLWRVAVLMGYVSERHVLLLVLCGVFTWAAAISRIGERLLALGSRLWPKTFRYNPAAQGGWLSVALLVGITGSEVPELSKPLHANRAGHRAAGLWLAEHAKPWDYLLDPFCWAHYYAGRVFSEGKTHEAPAGERKIFYVVLENTDNEHSRLPTVPTARTIASQGKAVYHWPEDKPANTAKVIVFATPVDPQSNN
jgi:hypothetical protein